MNAELRAKSGVDTRAEACQIPHIQLQILHYKTGQFCSMNPRILKKREKEEARQKMPGLMVL